MREQGLIDSSLGDSVSAIKKAIHSGERRKDVRFSVSASADMIELRTRTHLNGRASDLGASGCYVDTVTPLPVGASVMLTLASEKHSVHAMASVIYAKTGMGMGLEFAEMTAKQKENLSAWLRELSGESPQRRAPEANTPYVQEVAIEEPMIARPESMGLLEALEELISLLRVKRILSDTEVSVLREKMSK